MSPRLLAAAYACEHPARNAPEVNAPRRSYGCCVQVIRPGRTGRSRRLAHCAPPAGQNPVREKPKFARRFNARLADPTDPVLSRKDFASVFQNHVLPVWHPASMKRGASRSSRHVRRDCDGRFGDAREFFVRTNGAEADGKIVWSWPPDAEAKLAGVTNAAGDGSKKARFPGSNCAEIDRRSAGLKAGAKARPRLRRLKALTPSARRSVGLACARSWTERSNALDQLTATRSGWDPISRRGRSSY